MKLILFAMVILITGCNPSGSEVVKKSKVFATNDGNSYRVVCIDRVSYLQQNSSGNLTPKYAFNSNTPDTCEDTND